MDIDEFGPTGRAVYGYKHGYDVYRGWFQMLFEENWTLHPYINFLDEESINLLQKKTLLRKLVPIFAESLSISKIVDQIIGIDVINRKRVGPALIEKFANILIEEKESKETLLNRLSETKELLSKKNRSFSGIANNTKQCLSNMNDNCDGELISLESILCSVKSLEQFNPALASQLNDSNIKWVLTDLPPFSMCHGKKGYRGDFVALDVPEEIVDILYSYIPFERRLDWFPYVRIYGVFRKALSAKKIQIRAMKFAWLEIKRPETIDGKFDEFLKIADRQGDRFNDVHKMSALDIDDKDSATLLLSAIQMCLVSTDISYDLVKDRFSSYVNDAKSTIGDGMPNGAKLVFEE